MAKPFGIDRAGLNSASPLSTTIGPAGLASAPLADIRTGFRSGYVLEILDDRRPARAVMVHSFALNPSRYIITEPHQSTLTPTEDNSVVAEETGSIIREIQLEGTFGLLSKRGPAFRGDQGTRTGNEHFMHLRHMFRTYSRIKQDPGEGPHHSMVFHALRDDDHFVVIPRSFETARDAGSTRMHYPYRITLAVVAEAAFGARSLALPFIRNLSEAFHDARSYFAEAAAFLSDLKRVAEVETVLSETVRLINSVGLVLDGTADLIEYPLELAVNVVDDLASSADRVAESAARLMPAAIAESASRQLRRLEAAIDEIVAIPDKFQRSPSSAFSTYDGELGLSEEDLEEGTGGANIGSRTRLTRGSNRKAGFDVSSYRRLRREIVDRTTTISSLAQEYGVPAEVIIFVNNLKFPYITAQGGPGILKTGDVILIPQEFGRAADDQPTRGPGYLSPEEALYGIDAAIDFDLMRQTGQLDLMIANDAHDVDLRRGIDNVIQGTEITVRTERGTTTYVPEVGIRRSIGIKGTVQHMLLTALNLREGILADPRIEGIQDSEIVLDGDVLSQEITPRLRGDRGGVNFVLPFGSVSGG